MNLAASPMVPARAEEIRERVEALGPWFHNIRLGEVWTAPEHFLGDYPNVKFQRFAAHLPKDLSGKSVLDIGCNAGFYSMEMKRRGAERVLGIDSDDHYLAQARFAAKALSYDNIEFQTTQSTMSARSGRRSTSSSLWGCSIICGTLCWRSTLSANMSPATC
jgi:tRNA (mo5U34)-methyltransferase